MTWSESGFTHTSTRQKLRNVEHHPIPTASGTLAG